MRFTKLYKTIVMSSALAATLACSSVIAAAATVSLPKQRRTKQAREKMPKQIESEAAVRLVLDAQVAAWNRGDIEGFMDGYHRAPDIVFVSGDNVTRGWQTVLERYKKNYATKEKMGTLAFTDLEIKVFGGDHAVALGRWQLTRAGDTPQGRFTLLFRRTPEGWRIVHDHTSSAGS